MCKCLKFLNLAGILVCNNDSQLPVKDLRKLIAFIKANSNEIIKKWYEYFGEAPQQVFLQVPSPAKISEGGKIAAIVAG